MKVEYTSRAVADLRKISADSRRVFGDRVTEALEDRIRTVVERIGMDPFSTPELERRPGVHAVLLVRYPFRIFCRAGFSIACSMTGANPACQAYGTQNVGRRV